MASSWMNENKESIINNPQHKDIPKNLILSLSQTPVISGYLDKLCINSIILYKSWKPYYFRIHGFYMIFYVSYSSFEKQKLPKGFVDLREIRLEYIDSANKIILSSNDQELHLKKCCNKTNRNINEDQENPELSEWLLQLGNAIASSSSEPSSPEPSIVSFDSSILTSKDCEDFPQDFLYFMKLIGMVDESVHEDSLPSTSKLVINMKRISFILIYIYLSLHVIFTFRIPSNGCSDSVIIDKHKRMPCVLYFSLYLSGSIFYLTILISYYWLIKFGSNIKKMIRTHRKRMVQKINHFSIIYFRFQVFVCIIWVIATFAYNPPFQTSNILVTKIVYFFFSCMLGLFIFWSFLPCLVITVTYYSESRRLRLLLKDFKLLLFHHDQRCINEDDVEGGGGGGLLRQSNSTRRTATMINVPFIAKAYLEMFSEFEKVQNRLGFIMSVFAIGLFVETIGSSVVALYTFNGDTERLGQFDMRWWSPATSMLQFIPMLLVVLFTITSCNQRAGALTIDCANLIKASLSYEGDNGDDGSDVNVHEEGEEMKKNNSVSLLQSRLKQRKEDQSVHSSPSMVSSSILSMSSSSSSSIDNYHGGIEHIKLMKQSEQIHRLCSLIERQPCELRLLGRRVTRQDVVYICGFLVFVQIVNLFGISWAVPL